jgi:hypothetical protein
VTEKQHQISFTSQEIQALQALMDLGVKSGGLHVAEAAAVLNRKIMESVRASQTSAQNGHSPSYDAGEGAPALAPKT